jgi:hypothetical protein
VSVCPKPFELRFRLISPSRLVLSAISVQRHNHKRWLHSMYWPRRSMQNNYSLEKVCLKHRRRLNSLSPPKRPTASHRERVIHQKPPEQHISPKKAHSFYQNPAFQSVATADSAFTAGTTEPSTVNLASERVTYQNPPFQSVFTADPAGTTGTAVHD